MSQVLSLEKYITGFYLDYKNPAHEYLKILNGAEIGEPLVVYILAENAHKINAKMAKDSSYLFVLKIEGTMWPSRAPVGWINTPNGMFTCGRNICTSNGTYHPESYVVVSLESQILALFTAMCTNDEQLDHGISVVAYSEKRGPSIIKKSFASQQWNLNNQATIMAAIEQKYSEYSARWPKLPAGADPSRWILVKRGRGKAATEEYIELDPAITADYVKHQLIITGKVENYPEGFSPVEFPQIVDKFGNADMPDYVGISIIRDINCDDVSDLL